MIVLLLQNTSVVPHWGIMSSKPFFKVSQTLSYPASQDKPHSVSSYHFISCHSPIGSSSFLSLCFFFIIEQIIDLWNFPWSTHSVTEDLLYTLLPMSSLKMFIVTGTPCPAMALASGTSFLLVSLFLPCVPRSIQWGEKELCWILASLSLWSQLYFKWVTHSFLSSGSSSKPNFGIHVVSQNCS